MKKKKEKKFNTSWVCTCPSAGHSMGSAGVQDVVSQIRLRFTRLVSCMRLALYGLILLTVSTVSEICRNCVAWNGLYVQDPLNSFTKFPLQFSPRVF